MTDSMQAPPFPLGEGLASTTRFCLVPDDDATAAGKQCLVAFVPCERFEREGWHLLSADSVLRMRHCRSVHAGNAIEVISSDGNKVFSAEQFSRIIAGRIVGFALLDFSSRLLTISVDAW